MENIRTKNVNFSAVEMVNLLSELDLTAEESLLAITKVMHFVIEKGFCQDDSQTTKLIAKTMEAIVLTNAVCKN